MPQTNNQTKNNSEKLNVVQNDITDIKKDITSIINDIQDIHKKLDEMIKLAQPVIENTSGGWFY